MAAILLFLTVYVVTQDALLAAGTVAGLTLAGMLTRRR